MAKIGLALGGGGAKGFAQVPILEALDELGVRPACIAGTSVGAVIGALYAAGVSAREIRETVDDLVISEEDDWRDILLNKDLSRIAEHAAIHSQGKDAAAKTGHLYPRTAREHPRAGLSQSGRDIPSSGQCKSPASAGA